MYLKKIAEQIIRRYEAGNQGQDSRIQKRELYPLIKQVINVLIKKEAISTNMPLSELVPPNAALATYTATVTQPSLVSDSSEVCTLFGEFGQSSAPWLDDESTSWTTEDWEAWLVANLTGDVSITRSGYNFTIRVESVTYPFGKTPAQLEQFFSITDKNTYFELTEALWKPDTDWVTALALWWSTAGGESWVTSGDSDLTDNELPYRFAWAGITNFRAWDTGFEFDYNIDGANDSCTYLQNQLLESHGLLLDITDATTKEYAGAYYKDIKRCDVTCIDNSNNAEITMPAQPIALPRGMGIWRIYNPAAPLSSYVPVQAGNYAIASSVNHTNLDGILDGLIAYEWHSNNKVVFNKPSTSLPSTVNIQLVVVDSDTASEFDLLPIPADMEELVIVEVLNLIQPSREPDVATDQNTSR